MVNLVVKLQDVAGQYKELIMQSAYWQRVECATAVCTPILKLMRLSDGDVPSMGKVHYHAAKVSCDPSPVMVAALSRSNHRTQIHHLQVHLLVSQLMSLLLVPANAVAASVDAAVANSQLTPLMSLLVTLLCRSRSSWRQRRLQPGSGGRWWTSGRAAGS
jgi:hypothetical protein